MQKLDSPLVVLMVETTLSDLLCSFESGILRQETMYNSVQTITNFVYGLIFCCNAQGRGSLYMSSLVGILLFLRRSGRWQMPGLIINAVFGLELVVSAQVWWWAVARADYKCRLWFGFLLYFASLAEAGCQG